MEATQRAISSGVQDQTIRLQEENRNLREQVSAALKSVSAVQVLVQYDISYTIHTTSRRLSCNLICFIVQIRPLLSGNSGRSQERPNDIRIDFNRTTGEEKIITLGF